MTDEEEARYELKEKISFGYVLMDRLLSINRSFDHQDKTMLRAGLLSLYDNLTPYLAEEQRKPIDDAIEKLVKIIDKNDFLDEAHLLFRILLLTMRDLKLLTKEIRIDTY